MADGSTTTRGRGDSGTDLARLPSQPLVAARVLELLKSGNGSAAELARIIESDPVLSARVIRLASSPYYGMSGRVASAAKAVVLLGVSTVHGLAVSAARNLLDGTTDDVPADYWTHALVTASATSVVAGRVGLSPAEGFTLGLVHDVGILIAVGQGGTSLAEAAAADHATLGTEALVDWGFPRTLTRAVAAHHANPEDACDALSPILIAGEALGRQLYCPDWEPDDIPVARALKVLGLGVREASGLLADTEREVNRRATLLGVGR